jgi:hypothetical protein
MKFSVDIAPLGKKIKWYASVSHNKYQRVGEQIFELMSLVLEP